ncbi:sugar phosphate isomerase/epimerase [Crocinitomix catalasitica]|nr:sugar phosphate isomerase/epimerase [Crocinitomix catalasitica]
MRDFSNDISKLSINTATVKEQWTLQECVEGCARHGISSIAPWRDKLQECGVNEAAKMIEDHGLHVSSLCRGGFFTAGADAYNMDDNYRAVDEAAAIKAESLILVVGGLLSDSKNVGEARKYIEEGLAKLLEYSRKMNVPLALEPLHPMYAADRCCINTLGQAIDVCERLGEGIGVVVDVYHLWWDIDVEKQIARAGEKGLILGYHICDWLVPTQDILMDRGMMGDGIIDLKHLRSEVEDAGYNSYCEVEIFSKDNWWKRDPDEVLRTCIERFKSVV